MSVLVRTEDVPAAFRREYFHQALRVAVGPLDIRTGDGEELPDQVRVARFGAVRIGELSAAKAGGADRKRPHIRLLDADLCKVDVVTQGEILVEQLGRQAHLRAGDYALVDLSNAAHWRNTGASRLLSIAFPRP